MNLRAIVLVFLVATVFCFMLSAVIEARQIAEILKTAGLILLGAMVVQLVLFVVSRHLATIKNKIDKLIVGRRSV